MNADASWPFLYVAIIRDDYKYVNDLVQTDHEVLDLKDPVGWNLAHLSASHNAYLTLEYLFEHNKAIFTDLTPDGDSILSIAGSQGHLEALRWIIRKFRSSLHNMMSFALLRTAGRDQIDALNLLLRLDENVLAGNEWMDILPLWSVALMNSASRVLGKLAADYPVIQIERGRALDVEWLRAASRNDVAKLELLYEKQQALLEAVDVSNMNALHVAASRGACAVIQKLLEWAPGLLCSITRGAHTVLSISAIYNQIEAMEFLRAKYGDEIRCMEPFALYCAVRHNVQEAVDLIIAWSPRLLLSADIHNGNNVLHVTAMYDRLEMFNQFVALHPHLLNEPDKVGRTALHITAATGSVRVLKALLTINVEFARDNDGRTPHHLAALNDRLATLNILAQHRSDLTGASDFMGKTPLHLAAQKGHSAMIDTLLKIACPVDLHDERLSPFPEALTFDRADAITVLLEYDETILFFGAKDVASPPPAKWSNASPLCERLLTHWWDVRLEQGTIPWELALKAFRAASCDDLQTIRTIYRSNTAITRALNYRGWRLAEAAVRAGALNVLTQLLVWGSWGAIGPLSHLESLVLLAAQRDDSCLLDAIYYSVLNVVTPGELTRVLEAAMEKAVDYDASRAAVTLIGLMKPEAEERTLLHAHYAFIALQRDREVTAGSLLRLLSSTDHTCCSDSESEEQSELDESKCLATTATGGDPDGYNTESCLFDRVDRLGDFTLSSQLA